MHDPAMATACVFWVAQSECVGSGIQITVTPPGAGCSVLVCTGAVLQSAFVSITHALGSSLGGSLAASSKPPAPGDGRWETGTRSLII